MKNYKIFSPNFLETLSVVEINIVKGQRASVIDSHYR